MTWIVMTSSAQVRGRAREFGRYRNVAVVSVRYDMAMNGGPAMISERAKGVFCPIGARQAIIHLGSHSVGKTDRCAYARACARADDIAQRLNNSQPDALPEDVWTWGGSA